MKATLEINSVLKGIFPSNSMKFNYLPTSYQANFLIDRYMVYVEKYNEKQLEEELAKVHRLVAIGTEIRKKLKVKDGSILFNADLDYYSEQGKKNRKKIWKLQKEAFKLVQEMSEIDHKILDFCN